MSLFNFLNSGSNGGETAENSHVETNSDPSSLFGGMSITSPARDSTSTQSAFSFLSSAPTNAAEMDSTPTQSSFNFLSGATRDSQAYLDDSAQAIKLTKVAQTKTVKKKKKASRVGFARDGADEDEVEDEHHSELHSVTTAQAPLDLKNLDIENIQIPEPPKSPVPPPPPQSLPPPIPDIVEKEEINTKVKSDELPSHAIPVEHEEASQSTTDVKVDHTQIIKQEMPESTQSNNKSDTMPIESATKSIPLNSIHSTVSDPQTISYKPSNISSNEITDSSDVYFPAIVLSNATVKALESLSETFVNISKRQKSVISEIRENLKIISSLEEKITVNRVTLLELESEQQRVVLLEDFDRAAAIDSQIEYIRNEIQSSSAMILNIKSSFASLYAQLDSNRNLQLEAIDIAVEKVSEFSEKEIKLIDEITECISSKQAAEGAKLRSENDRIELEKVHIEKEELALNEESEMIDDTIRSQCGDVSEQKALIEIELTTVSCEIAELERTLEAKRLEEKNLKSSLTGLDARIHDIKRKYDRQLHRIQERRDLLTKSKYEWSTEKSSITAMIENFEKESLKIETSRSTIVEASETAESEVELMCIIKNSLAKLINFSTYGQSDQAYGGDMSSYQQLQAAVAEADIELASVASSRAAIKSELDTLVLEGNDIIEDKLPKLENEKKIHAAAKRFKEAAAAAKDIKTLSTRKEEIDEISKNLSAALSSKDDDMKIALEKQSKALTLLRQAQLKVDRIRFDSLVTHISYLKQARKRIVNAAKGRRMLAVDSCINYLNTEILILSFEADDINAKHKLCDSPDGEYGSDDIEASTETSETVVTVNDDESSSSESLNRVVDSGNVTFTASDPQVDYSREAVDISDLTRQKEEYESAIVSLNARLEKATEEEDYELAANLFEEIEQQTNLLNQVNISLAQS